MDRFLEFALNHYLLVMAVLVVLYFLIQDFTETAFKKFTSITPLLAVAKMNDSTAIVIDVREPIEFMPSHIKDSINIPLGKIAEELPNLEQYKNTPILISCQSGTRSATAGRMLTKAGFEHVFVITGGMQSWESDYKLPIKKGSIKQQSK
ncbi:MAG: rhodanese-like domain-containing protein [Methylovulum sp.]|nr:rhodanese-like domain-containing protein [Methylovulum sp.]TSA40109.1 MAG: rhodanese-like domain-containing protein [Methylococcaceae bacterium]